MLQTNKQWVAMITLLGAALLWGASFSGSAFLVERYSGFTIMWFRLLFASLAFFALPRKWFKFDYQKGDWKKLLPMGILMPCLYFTLETRALTMTSSIQAGVISSVVPLFVTLGAVLFLKERVTGNIIAGMVLSVGGVILLTLFQGDGGNGSQPLLGNTLETFAMVCAAGSMLLVKNLSTRYNAFSLTRLQCLVGLFFFLPGLFFLGPDFIDNLTRQDLLAFLFLGIGSSFGAFLLYNIGLGMVSASSASISINLVPVFALIFGWLIRGELLNQWQVLASVLVLGGVIWSQRKG